MRGCEAKQSREASPGRLDGSKASALTGFVASHRAEAVAHILICQDIGLNGRRHLLHVLEAAKDAWMCASQSPCGNTRNGCVTRQPQLYATILSPSPPPLAPTFLPPCLPLPLCPSSLIFARPPSVSLECHIFGVAMAVQERETCPWHLDVHGRYALVLGRDQLEQPRVGLPSNKAINTRQPLRGPGGEYGSPRARRKRCRGPERGTREK
jgi:hypothetical protein